MKEINGYIELQNIMSKDVDYVIDNKDGIIYTNLGKTYIFNE